MNEQGNSDLGSDATFSSAGDSPAVGGATDYKSPVQRLQYRPPAGFQGHQPLYRRVQPNRIGVRPQAQGIILIRMSDRYNIDKFQVICYVQYSIFFSSAVSNFSQ